MHQKCDRLIGVGNHEIICFCPHTDEACTALSGVTIGRCEFHGFIGSSLVAKQIDLMREVLPGVTRIAVLVNPKNPLISQDTLASARIATNRLCMESLRQIYARHGMAITDKIGAVIFASPDIDMDVFTSSVQRIPPLVPKITVITATNDRALAVAGWIAGGITRVGAAEKSQLEKVGLRVIDASAEGWGLINHDLFLSNAQIRLVIRRAVDGLPLDHS
jgi:Alpha/beta hydrolase of unknown function (DUF900)